MNHYPLISVVITLYNGAQYIRRSVQSVLAQTYSYFELIVVDDGSVDGGGDICLEFTDPRLRLVRQENAGVSSARNKGIAESRCEYIAFLDADDEWKTNFLEKIFEMIEKYPHVGMYCTNREHRLPNGKDSISPLRYPLMGIPKNDDEWTGILDDYFLTAQGRPPVSSSSVVIKRKVLQKTGGFCEHLNIGEDIDLWARIALVSPIAYCALKLSIYHQYPNKCRYGTMELPFFKEAELTLKEKKLSVEREFSLRQYVTHLRLAKTRRLLDFKKLSHAITELKKTEFLSGYKIRIMIAWIRCIILRICFKYDHRCEIVR